ncbi:hypothetical protein M378DRAFT_587717 [Amanita muscaria Koide BX008]|uniref:Uncharacterized protein n=1 Tax=Amanita muscaria (strain Koide BX008) TaxID=946122 RepID=A0A0C2X5B2_AMAMK|nr:hypothetical protein M378DRAFT_587717 [Amanita muscaria Koide BX008]
MPGQFEGGFMIGNKDRRERMLEGLCSFKKEEPKRLGIPLFTTLPHSSKEHKSNNRQKNHRPKATTATRSAIVGVRMRGTCRL